MIDEDLHVFIPNTEKIDESVKQFVDMYSLRTRKNREYWLIDIGYWTANVEDITTLQMLTDKLLINYYFHMLLLQVKMCKLFKGG